jgi:hypothetical protein
VQTGVTPGDVNKHLAKTAEEIRQCKEQMISGEASDVDRSTRRLQQAFSKMQHKIRKAGLGPGSRSLLPASDCTGVHLLC